MPQIKPPPERYLYCCWNKQGTPGYNPADHIIGVATIHAEPFEVDGITYDLTARSTVDTIRPMIDLLEP